MLPLFYAYILHKRSDKLHKDKNKGTIGTLYEGFVRNKEGKSEKAVKKKRHAYIYPMAFLWRRTAFIVITVWLFEYPVLQMAVHIWLSLFNLCLLAGLKENFTTKQRLFVELFVEGMSILACIWLQ